MDKNPYRSPESEPEVEEQPENSPNLSLRDVLDALPGWVSLTILLILMNLIGMWASTSRPRMIVCLSVTGILAISVVVWLVQRIR